MEINAFLADSVVSAEGKLYAQGMGWDVIHVQAVPARHSRIGVGLVIDVPYTATNQAHDMKLRLEDEDGNQVKLGEKPAEDGPEPVMSLGGQFNMETPRTLPAGHSQVISLALTMDGLVFEKAGGYRFVISIDGSEVKRLPFRLQLPPNISA